MEKIIEKLYKIHLEEEQLPFGVMDKEVIEKEYEAYCLLSQTLPQDMRKQLSEYANLNEERRKVEMQAVYQYGFKTAIRLILEGIKE